MRSLFRNKRGVAGIDFMKSLAIGIFVIVIVFFALAIAGANLRSSTSDTTAQTLIDNFTGAIAGFGSHVSTWLVLGALVVLISIIVVVILVVQRVQQGRGNL